MSKPFDTFRLTTAGRSADSFRFWWIHAMCV